MRTAFAHEAFKGIAKPLPNIYHKHLTLTCDSTGHILDIGNTDSYRYGSIIQALKTKGNIRELFEMGPRKSLDDLPESSWFRLKTGFVFSDAMENFYTTLPMAALEINRAAKGYLGVISVSDLLPTFFPEKSTGIVLLDPSGRLLGFNETFYKIFKDANPAPEQMLGKAAETFFSPTPDQQQSMHLRNFKRLGKDQYVPAFEHDFAKNGEGVGMAFAGSSEVSYGGDGLSWKNSGNDTALLNLPPSFDAGRADLQMEITLRILRGPEPLIFLGARQDNPAIIGENSYLLGKLQDMDKCVIKKSGFNIAGADYPEPGGASHQLSFFEKGRALFLYRGEKRIIGYYDEDFSAHHPARLSLGLRPGGECVIEKIFIGTREFFPEKDDTLSHNDTIIRLEDGRRTYCLLNRFHSYALTTAEPYFGVAGYFLQDITGLQERAQSLERRYKEQLARGEQLNSLLKEYRNEQEGFVGAGAEMAGIKEKARVIADSNATVLIQGATGTGKEVLARFIHTHSPFKKGPFVKVDCSTLPKELMESELFGHEKGAFTGALSRKIGMMEQANHGTFFLDEVGNLTREAQAKLLQFLQDFAIIRIGGDKPIQLTLRVVAATNIELKELVRQGLFREDLFYRLFVAGINLPALKERKEDLADLCGHFLNVFNLSMNKNIKRISPDAFRKLYDHAWPGNIRELKNVIQQAVLFCKGDEITADLILPGQEPVVAAQSRPSRAQQVNRPSDEPYHFLNEFPKEKMSELLERNRGHAQKSARELGISARALYYYLKRKGMDINAFRKRG